MTKGVSSAGADQFFWIPGMSAVLPLPNRLDLPAAKPLAAEILSHRGKNLTIACGAVAYLGTPGLQVLLAAARTWAEDGNILSFSDISETMTEQLSVFGLAPEALGSLNPKA